VLGGWEAEEKWFVGFIEFIGFWVGKAKRLRQKDFCQPVVVTPQTL
jgi:hypothetical protein